MSQTKHDKKVIRLFKKIGLCDASKIAQTLQGSIWRASEATNTAIGCEKSVVIKVTDRSMHEQQMSIINGKRFHVHEDILLEQSLLKYLTEDENCPQSIVKFKRFFKSSTDYYLIMDDGGKSLFDFILKAHQLIRAGEIEISEWQRVVRIIYQQMIEIIEYLHSKNVCHMDISIENFLINDIKIEIMQSGASHKIQFKTDDIQIKLCDFGLAKLFTRDHCKSNKFCGKKNYKSPEVVQNKKKFDAKKNDIWCAGVCLFMMLLGTAPWMEARESDETFTYIMNGKLLSLLISWDVLHFVDAKIIDLIESIFQYEADRMSLYKMKQHPWLNIQSKN